MQLSRAPAVHGHRAGPAADQHRSAIVVAIIGVGAPLRPAHPVRAVRGPGRGRGEVQPGGRAAAGHDAALAAARRQDPRPGPARAGADRAHRRRRRASARWPSTWSTSRASWSGRSSSVVLWFVLGYALYASIFAAAASLVSRQEDLGTRDHADDPGPGRGLHHRASRPPANPAGALATITSFVPGLSPLVMPVRMAAGDVALWEVAARRRPHARRDRRRRPARRADLRRRAAAHRRQDQAAGGAAGRAASDPVRSRPAG